MLAVTTVLPLSLKGLLSVTVEIQITQDVAPVLAFNRALSRSEESPLVFMTEYSHCCNSLGLRTAFEAAYCTIGKGVLRANHGLVLWRDLCSLGGETGENSTILNAGLRVVVSRRPKPVQVQLKTSS